MSMCRAYRYSLLLYYEVQKLHYEVQKLGLE